MLNSLAYSKPTVVSRPGEPGAAFFVPCQQTLGGVIMGRRPGSGAPAPRKEVPRYANGKINYRRAREEEPDLPYYVMAQRLRDVDSSASDILLCAHNRPRRRLNAEQRAELMAAARKAEDRRLGYPLGRLWMSGMLGPPPTGFETSDEAAAREEKAALMDKAAGIYAGQHFLVWNGRGSPGQALPSHLEKILTEVTGGDLPLRPFTDLDPEEEEKARRRLEASLAGARRALAAAEPVQLAALKAVDLVCIDKPPGVKRTAAEVAPGAKAKWLAPTIVDIEMRHLRAGLEALCAYYNVRPAAKRGGQDRPSGPALPAAAASGDAPAQPVVIHRNVPRGLPVSFGPNSTHRPPAEAIRKAVRIFKGLTQAAAEQGDEA